MSRDPNATLEHLEKIVNALQKKLPTGTVSLKISGVSTPVSSLVTSMSADLALYVTARDAREQERQAVAAVDTADSAVHSRIAMLHKALEMELGTTSPVLADFGFSPQHPPRQLTPEEKAAKTAKAKATRLKNGTLGRRQKRARDAQPPAPPASGPGHS